MLSMRFYGTIAHLAAPGVLPEEMELLDKLTKEAIEEGKETAFVRALLIELRTRLASATGQLVENAAVGDPSQKLYALAGRAAELRNVIRMIENTEGKETES
jgi:hypothetical protein